jgi:hypothetical protein
MAGRASNRRAFLARLAPAPRLVRRAGADGGAGLPASEGEAPDRSALVLAELRCYICARSAAMPKTPPEPTNLVLEQLRLMRADMNARFDQIQQDTNSRFDRLEAKITNVERDLRGLKLNTIAEV